MNQDLLGLRPEDLSPDERALLAEDPELGRAHAREAALGDALGRLPAPVSPPSAEQVLARLAAQRAPSPRAWPAAAAGGLGLAAAFLLAWLPLAPDEPTQRDRGVAGAPTLRIQAAAEDPRGALRTVESGGSVAADERVLFRVGTSHAGHLVLRAPDTGEQLMPLDSGWLAVEAGEHRPGGDQPLSWRPDARPDPGGSETPVVATWCPEPPAGPDAPVSPGCLTTVFQLWWTP